MNLHTAIFLFFAGALGGGINAVAGGGSFVAFPALLFTGVLPIPANATNTLALWVGTTASSGAYSRKLEIARRVMIPLVLTSILGGLAGAFLLIKTPAQTFLHVLPWLMLGATLLFAFGKHLTGRISAGISHDGITADGSFIVLPFDGAHRRRRHRDERGHGSNRSEPFLHVVHDETECKNGTTYAVGRDYAGRN